MAFDPGHDPGGVSGIIDVPGFSGKIEVYIRDFKNAFITEYHNITGPGDAQQTKGYGSNVGGTFTCDGDVREDQYPFPVNLNNVKGNITIQMDTGCSILIPILIESLALLHRSEKDNVWKVAVAAHKDGAFSYPGWNGTLQVYSAPTLSIKEINAGTVKVLDANNLYTHYPVRYLLPLSASTNAAISNAVTNFISVTAAPATGLKFATAAVHRLDDKAAFMLGDWSLLSTADRVTIPHLHSFRSNNGPATDSVGTLTAASSTVAIQSNTLFAAWQANAFADSVTLEAKNDLERVAIYHYFNPGVQVIGESGPLNELMPARFSGGSIQLFVMENYLPFSTSTRRWIRLSKMRLTGATVRRFKILRMIVSTVLPDQSPTTINGVTLPLFRQTNNASFLGLAAGTCQYLYATYSVNISAAGTFNFKMEYHFEENSSGFFDNVPDNLFKGPQWFTTASTTKMDWVNSSALNVSTITQPSQASFAAFVA